jgi:arginine repressor
MGGLIMTEKKITKEERQEVIKDIIRKNKFKKETEVYEKLKEKNIEVSAPTVSRDFKDINHSRDENGHYILEVDLVRERKKNLLIEILDWDSVSTYGFSNVTTVSENKEKKKYIYTILIKISIGVEHTVEELIHLIFKNNIIGSQIGRGCVTVYADDRTKYREIKDFLVHQKKLNSNINKC